MEKDRGTKGADCVVAGLKFKPQFEGVIEGWVVNYLRTQYWRLSSSLQYEDVMQEAWVIYLDCVRRYPYVDTPQWFFSLFKLSFVNQVNDLSKRDSTCRRAPPVSSVLREDQQAPDQTGDLDTDGGILRMLTSAPAEIGQILMLVLNSPKEMLGVCSGGGKLSKQRRARANNAWCAAVGKNPQEYDLVRSVERYFGVQLS